MLSKRIVYKTTMALGVIAFLSWANTTRAALPDDVNAALASGSQAQKVAAIQALALAYAGDQAKFRELALLIAAGSTKEQIVAHAGALAAGCGASGDNAATTRTIILVTVESYYEVAGAITGAVIRAGCSASDAAGVLQEALATAAGGALSVIPVLPNNNPGTGSNLLQEAFYHSLITTRLGNVLQGTQETAMSPTQPNYVPPTTDGNNLD